LLEAEPARGGLLIAGEPGNAIVDEVAPIAGELVLHTSRAKAPFAALRCTMSCAREA
jgi:hypothetical protein